MEPPEQVKDVEYGQQAAAGTICADLNLVDEPGNEALVECVQGGGEQFALGAVVAVDGDLGDRCFRHHLIDAEGSDPLAVEEGLARTGDLQGRRLVDSSGDGFVILGALH